MENRVSASITAAVKAQLGSIVTNILSLLPFLINLTPAARKKIRKMAIKRAGYVADVYNAVMANPSVIPATFSVPEYTKDKVLFDDMAYVINLFETILEALHDTQLQLSHELMQQSDACYDYLKRAAKDNASLSETVKKVGTAFASQGIRSKGVVFQIPAKGIVSVDSVAPGSRIVNNGNTILSFKAGAELAKILKKTAISINPGNAEVIPAGFTSIIVENVSETADGSFTVKIK
jgi:hypothetical protein